MKQETRQNYNLKILEIIEKNVYDGLIIEKLESVLEKLKVSEYVVDLSFSPKTDEQHLIDLKDFYKNNPGMRFLQGLINLGYIADSMSDWVEESSVTYSRVKEYGGE